MHEKAMEKIKGKLLGSLKRCAVLDNWPQYESFHEHVNSLSKEVLKHKSEWLTDVDVFSIYYDLVYESIVAKAGVEHKFSGVLPELLNDEELETVADKLTSFYLSIPRSYFVYYPLPKVSRNIQDSIKISNNIELSSFDNAKDIPGGYKGVGLLQFREKFDINKVYLKFTVDGYCNSSLENKAIKSSLSSFKVIMQQGLCKGLFEIKEGQPAGLGLLGGLTHHQIPKSNIVSVDSTVDDSRVISIELPIEISKLIDSIDFNWENEKVNTPYEDNNFALPVNGYLRLPSLLVESKEPESKKVKSAVEWCFDSSINENETMSFLQTCIGLESILGDAESNGGLTELLADRCSYLLGTDIKGRSKIKKNFKDLYRVRSKLVHGVKTGLEHDQKWYKKWGLDTLELSILKEIKHLNLK